MSKKRMPFFKGAYYHLYNKNLIGTLMFQDKQDYYIFIERLYALSEILGIRIIAFCLMPTHFHILVQQCNDFPAGLLIARIFNSYSKRYNFKYKKKGRWLQSTYKAKQVSDSAYLTHLCRYIHANPILAGLTDQPHEWPFTNFHMFTKEMKKHENIPQILTDKKEYKTFLQEYIQQNEKKQLQYDNSLPLKKTLIPPDTTTRGMSGFNTLEPRSQPRPFLQRP